MTSSVNLASQPKQMKPNKVSSPTKNIAILQDLEKDNPYGKKEKPLHQLWIGTNGTNI
jgi:hypothetical protein